jgi:hypothetical protein
MKSTAAHIDNFDGDFDMLPLRAHIEYGAVPEYPTEGDFAMAVTMALGNAHDPAAQWRLEAIRERRLRPGVTLESAKAEINRRAAARMFAYMQETA